jgi:cytochrome P450
LIEAEGGLWMLSRYDDVRRAAMDWRTFTSSVVGVTAIPVIIPRTEPQLPIEIDPPLHSRYRALINPVFSADRVEALRPAITAIANRLIDGLLQASQPDAVTAYAAPLSLETLVEFTGLPREDTALWVSWLRRMFNPHDPQDVQRASVEYGQYIRELIAARKRSPTADFISRLLASEHEGHQLSENELHAFMTLLLGAGFETTADAISVTLLYLAEHPEARARLRAEPQLIPAAVEEFLRYVTPVQLLARNTTYDIELHGRVIPDGDVVGLGFGAANHCRLPFSRSACRAIGGCAAGSAPSSTAGFCRAFA